MVQQHPRKVRHARSLGILVALLAFLALPAVSAAHTLNPPSDLQATQTSDGVSLTWTDNGDSHTQGYYVYRGNGRIAETVDTNHLDAGATDGTYRVTAFDGSGGESAPTNDATVGSGSGGSGPAATADVTVDSDFFSPSTVEVKPGGTVTWHWAGGTHTVTADPGQAETFDTTQSAGTFSHTFTNQGRFTYLCRRHGGMTGVVVVRDAPAGPDNTAPATPGGLTAVPGDRNVSLDWPDVTDPDLAGYKVERQNIDGTWATVAETATSSYADSGLTNGSGYAYRVSAFDLASPRNESAPTDPVAATPSATAAGPSERVVTVGGYAFGPEDIVVNAGDTVVWSWAGPDFNHSVTSAADSAESFESHPGVADGDVTSAPAGGFRHTFATTGTYAYLCRVHPDMTAKVTVVAGGADQAAAGGGASTAPARRAQTAAPAASNHVVKVAQYKFTPANLTVEQGDSVTWKWTGSDKDHSVSTKPGQADGFDSHEGLKLGQIKSAPEGGSFVHVFSTKGTFTYICRLHPTMVGKVTVVARSAAAPLKLRPGRASVRGSRLTVRFTLTGPGTVRAQLRRAGRTLRTYRFSGKRGANARRLVLPKAARRAGRYRLTLLAARPSGDKAAPVSVSLRVPR